jgi:hypothetical protein
MRDYETHDLEHRVEEAERKHSVTETELRKSTDYRV